MSHWGNKYVIGLTGNIAVGKSVVRQMLQHAGAYTIDADNLSHQAMLPGAPAYKPVINTFGQFIVGSDGKINRKLLGDIVFTNPDALQKLERIVQPVVRQAIEALVKRAKQRVIVIEAIKLLEGGMGEMVDAVWVVDAKPQTQYKRLIQKRKMSQDDAKKRILAQSPQKKKLAHADVVINNDGNIEQTWKQVQAEWANIRQQLINAAKQKGAPAEAETIDAPEPTSHAASGLVVRRGSPNNAEHIAKFIASVSGDQTTRMDVMMRFGQKSYLIAQKEGENTVVALLGWTVENLVTRMDEVYFDSNVSIQNAVHEMTVAVEEASKELQSEVGFIFLPMDTAQSTLDAFTADGYEKVSPPDIKIPAWREAVEEMMAESPKHVLWKQLRKDRVLQPI